MRTVSAMWMRARAMMDGLPVHCNFYGALGHSRSRPAEPAVSSDYRGAEFLRAWLGVQSRQAHIFAGAMAGKSVGQMGLC